jgi:hypothetical protein
MKIEREVILDLLPLYAAGELSPQSQRLVEEALEQDAALRKLVKALSASKPADGGLAQLDRQLSGLAGTSAGSSAEEEKRSFSRARLLMGLRSVLVGAAIFATLWIFAFWFDGDTVVTLIEAFPRLVRNLAVVAVLLWVLAFFLEFLWGMVSDALSSLFKRK